MFESETSDSIPYRFPITYLMGVEGLQQEVSQKRNFFNNNSYLMLPISFPIDKVLVWDLDLIVIAAFINIKWSHMILPILTKPLRGVKSCPNRHFIQFPEIGLSSGVSRFIMELPNHCYYCCFSYILITFLPSLAFSMSLSNGRP